MTTVCGMAAALSDDSIIGLAMNRLSTHPVENLIGLTRDCSHSQHTFENVINSFAKMALANRFKDELSIPKERSKRINIGGVSVDIKSPFEIKYEISPSLFAHVITRTVHASADILKEEDYIRLNSYIWSYILKIEQNYANKKKIYEPHPSSCHSIMTRNICNSFTKKEEHKKNISLTKWTDGFDELILQLIEKKMTYDRLSLILNSTPAEIQIRQDHIVAARLLKQTIYN